VPELKRCRTGLDPGWRENAIHGRPIAKSGEAAVGPGPQRSPDPTKGPCRWKAPRVVTSHLLSRGGGHGDLGGFLTRESDTARKSPSFGRRREGATDRPAAAGRGDRGARGSIAMGAVDRQRPRSRAPRRETRSFERHGNVCPVEIRRSVPDAVKRSVPWEAARSPRLRGASTRRKSRSEPGTLRGAGARTLIQVAEVGRTHRAPCPP